MQPFRNKPRPYIFELILLIYLFFSYYFHLRNEINLLFNLGTFELVFFSGIILLGVLFIPILMKLGKLPLKLFPSLTLLFICIDFGYILDIIPQYSVTSLVCLSIMGFVSGTILVHNTWKRASSEILNTLAIITSAILVSSLWFPLNENIIHYVMVIIGVVSWITFLLMPKKPDDNNFNLNKPNHPFLDWICYTFRFFSVHIFNYILIYGMYSRHFFEITYRIFGYRGNRYYVEADIIQIAIYCIIGGIILSMMINTYFKRSIIHEGKVMFQKWVLLFGILIFCGICIGIIVEIPAAFTEFRLLVYLFFGFLGISEGMIYSGIFILQYYSFIQQDPQKMEK